MRCIVTLWFAKDPFNAAQSRLHRDQTGLLSWALAAVSKYWALVPSVAAQQFALLVRLSQNLVQSAERQTR